MPERMSERDADEPVLRGVGNEDARFGVVEPAAHLVAGARAAPAARGAERGVPACISREGRITHGGLVHRKSMIDSYATRKVTNALHEPVTRKGHRRPICART